MSKSNSPSSSTVSTGSSSFHRRAQGRSGQSSHRAQPNVACRTGGGEGNFACKTCGKKFVSKNALYGHQNVHPNKPPKRVRDCLSLEPPGKKRPTAASPPPRQSLPPSPPPSAPPRGKEVHFASYVVARSGPPLVIGGSSTPAVGVTSADQPMVPIAVTHVVPMPVPMSMVINGTGHGVMIRRNSVDQGSNPRQNRLRSEVRGHVNEGDEKGNRGALVNGGEEQQEVDLELRLGWK
ncbi:hypothetical protein Ancab_030914 [Ancistrocladus abbreviatus]